MRMREGGRSGRTKRERNRKRQRRKEERERGRMRGERNEGKSFSQSIYHKHHNLQRREGGMGTMEKRRKVGRPFSEISKSITNLIQ